MKLELNDDQKAILDTVRQLAQTKFRQRVSKWQDGTFPYENLKELGEIGVLGMAVPEEHGGLGLPVLDCVLVLEEVAKVCYVTAMAAMSAMGAQNRIIANFAPEELRRKFLPGVITGETILAICMTEPHAGTDVANYKTNTVVHDDRVVLNGTKTLISRADEAHCFIVFTRVDNKPGREGIGCVLVEPGTPGFEVTARYHTMGGENLAEIQFRDMELPLENLIIREDGFKKLLTAFNTQRCMNPSVSLGLAEGAFEEAVKYVRQREIFGRPTGSMQGMRWKIADMAREIEVARSILYRAAATADPFPDPYLAAIAKIQTNEMAIRVTSDALQVHGGYGFTDEYPVSHFYRGARYGTLGGGATETLKDLVGKRVYDAFPEDGFLSFGMM
ncbi:acyl-CoA dehydrogenase family protein [Oricola sp.]|uniref:acyl-CoA dehydrogenase family protein n=1 Tax=Oricola sp. TaxID=1979950 RepID=UPI0025CEE290|nr:acyl-CoA dehydrogenase family protein [Oricola sp.]MCI5075384.1 acyl-CoA dehydrogenase family protein [Oricola sp.]